MTARLKRVWGIPLDGELQQIGRGFVVRDLPWTAEKLIPPFEFENWAVIALGGISPQSSGALSGHGSGVNRIWPQR